MESTGRCPFARPYALDLVEQRLALLAVQLARLLFEEPVHVGIAAVRVGAWIVSTEDCAVERLGLGRSRAG